MVTRNTGGSGISFSHSSPLYSANTWAFDQTFTGDLVMGTSGKGIDFSATADAGTSTPSELLDDYEEGTWTPTLVPSSGAITSYSSQVGFYTKIGNHVHLHGYLLTSDVGDGAGGGKIGGLPFNVPNTTGAWSALNVGVGSGFAITAGVSVAGQGAQNAAAIELTTWDATAGTSAMQVDSEWTDNGGMIFSFEYNV